MKSGEVIIANLNNESVIKTLDYKNVRLLSALD
nr:hypothetical protein [Pseudoalteromonas phenolica]